MQDFNFIRPEAEVNALVLPTRISLRAASITQSLHLTAYCSTPEPIIHAIRQTVHRMAGTIIDHPAESDRGVQRIRIGAQLPRLSNVEGWQLRSNIQTAGGMVETLRMNYQVHRSIEQSQQRPRACAGCRYYYGKAYGHMPLVCALHPYGPNEESCPDWA